MTKYYLAVDIGASSGRHIIGHLDSGRLVLQEIHRFENKLHTRGGYLCWDSDTLFREIIAGMKKCGPGRQPASVGIDTWAVDFALLDRQGRLLGDTVGYRDHRTDGMDAVVEQFISAAALYRKTGIQKQPFNTIYQLAALKKEQPELLAQAARLLMLPEYFSYLLSGEMKNEYTNATSTNLVNALDMDWDADILNAMGLRRELFGTLNMPGTRVGRLTSAIQQEVGYDCDVVFPATHDTASAVLAVPSPDADFIYLSSGTWSLLGVELAQPNCSPEAQQANFTNEGGVAGRYRFLKNIMGLWIIQSIKRELKEYTYDQLCDMAMLEAEFNGRIDVNDPSFLSPENMTEAVLDYCRRHGQAAPATTGQLMRCVYASLADSYAAAVAEIEQITGKIYKRLHIVGGGSKDKLLNQLTAEATGKEVWTGPAEATAAGNIAAQMLGDGSVVSVEEARNLIRDSFTINMIHI